MRRLLKPWPLLLLAFLLWGGTSLVVVASQAPQTPPAQTPAPAKPEQPKKPNPFAEDEQKPAEKKGNRFMLTEEEEEEDEKAADVPTSTRRFFSGTAACTKCHEKQAKPYNKGRHAHAWDPRTPSADIGCETCHGPGKAHDDAPAIKGLVKNPLRMSPRDASEICLNCHERADHAGWQGSMHDARSVTCVDCHSIHKPKTERSELREPTVGATCARCHAEKSAKLRRASHMPLAEGKMDCGSCHNAHGSNNVRMLKAGSNVNESCLSCHAEKRGPFLWEHAPVAASCVTCHDAHGSSNEAMLSARTPMLCQRCHIATRHPATPYDGTALAAGSNRLLGRNCLNCHQMVHGSNHPSGMFYMR